MNYFDLSGKIALVTGGTRGIGLAIAQGFKEAGARVWIHGLERETTERIAAQNGFEALYGDLREENAAETISAAFLSREKRLDILVNNAGFERYFPIENACEQEMKDMFSVNLRSPYFLLNRLLPALKNAPAASVINITSIHETVPVRTNGTYCMTKAALAMLTKVAALELAKYHIRVNNLAPGAILTDMNRAMVEKMDFSEWIPLGRVGDITELAGPAIFLASDAASYVTGTTLFVDGGYHENLLRY